MVAVIAQSTAHDFCGVRFISIAFHILLCAKAIKNLETISHTHDIISDIILQNTMCYRYKKQRYAGDNSQYKLQCPAN